MVYVENKGLRFGPVDLLQKLKRGEPVDPKLIYFRTVPKFETGAEKYRWLMEHVFIGSAARHADRVVIDVHQVLSKAHLADRSHRHASSLAEAGGQAMREAGAISAISRGRSEIAPDTPRHVDRRGPSLASDDNAVPPFLTSPPIRYRT